MNKHASAIAHGGRQGSASTDFTCESVLQTVRVVKRGLCRSLLTFAVLAPPPQQTWSLGSRLAFPAFHRSQVPRYQIPREAEEQPPRELSTTEVRQQIQEKVRTEPGLADAKIRVEADDSSVVLAGAVDHDCQRDLALRIAESYAGKRRIVDKIKRRVAKPGEPDGCEGK